MKKKILGFIMAAALMALLSSTAFGDEWDGSSAGKLFYLNGRVGIGTDNPLAGLHIKGDGWPESFIFLDTTGDSQNVGIRLYENGTMKYHIYNHGPDDHFRIAPQDNLKGGFFMTPSGRIGIGTANPKSTLEVAGTIFSTGVYDVLKIGANYNQTFLRYDEANYYIAPYGAYTGDPASANTVSIGGGPNDGKTVQFRTVSNTFLATFNGGVGIGTENIEGYKLAVNGSIRAKEVRVNTDWADFVFEDDYELQPLESVEDFIDENGHLPGIPSAEEVEKEGISLGEIDAKLLQKIEELTLYMIEVKKENQSLKNKIEELEDKLN